LFEEEYKIEKTWQLSLVYKSSLLLLWLVERLSGGFDLLLDREGCNWDDFEVDQITKIRHLVQPHGMVLVANFAGCEVTREMKKRAEDAMTSWLLQTIGFQPAGKMNPGWVEAELEC